MRKINTQKSFVFNKENPKRDPHDKPHMTTVCSFSSDLIQLQSYFKTFAKGYIKGLVNCYCSVLGTTHIYRCRGGIMGLYCMLWPPQAEGSSHGEGH